MNRISESRVRLPLWLGLEEHQSGIITTIRSLLKQIAEGS